MSANEELEVKIVEEVFVEGELVELVIIEEFAKRGEKPPHAKTYVIRIDKETYRLHKPQPNRRRIASPRWENLYGIQAVPDLPRSPA